MQRDFHKSLKATASSVAMRIEFTQLETVLDRHEYITRDDVVEVALGKTITLLQKGSMKRCVLIDDPFAEGVEHPGAVRLFDAIVECDDIIAVGVDALTASQTYFPRIPARHFERPPIAKFQARASAKDILVVVAPGWTQEGREIQHLLAQRSIGSTQVDPCSGQQQELRDCSFSAAVLVGWSRTLPTGYRLVDLWAGDLAVVQVMHKLSCHEDLIGEAILVSDRHSGILADDSQQCVAEVARISTDFVLSAKLASGANIKQFARLGWAKITGAAFS
ncbi:hypothetical protein [Methylosinus sp. PW1]|uniref:hypothetical protein n=1 Tax=Methylosinus sp. PW1 TaxID=107636 RepID=UPI0018DD6722|nr:hypothetical protein [Methylosinus sp. PW1]